MFTSTISKDDIQRDEMLEPSSNLNQTERNYQAIWNDSSKERYRFISFSQYNDSKSQSQANHDDINYQSGIVNNHLSNLNLKISIEPI